MLLKPKLPREWIITQINDRLGNKLQMHLVPKNSSNATCRLRAPWGGHRHFQIRKLKQRQQHHLNPTSTHLVNSPAFHSILIPHHNKNVAKKSQIFFNFGGYKTGWWQGGWSEGWRWKRYYTSVCFHFTYLTVATCRETWRHPKCWGMLKWWWFYRLEHCHDDDDDDGSSKLIRWWWWWWALTKNPDKSYCLLKFQFFMFSGHIQQRIPRNHHNHSLRQTWVGNVLLTKAITQEHSM